MEIKVSVLTLLGALLVASAFGGGFTATLDVDLSAVAADETLYEVGPMKLSLRFAGKLLPYDVAAGNYVNFPMPDGSCPVLEAVLPTGGGRVGVPLACLAKPDGVHRVTLNLTDAVWTICTDGCTDEDFPHPATPIAWPEKLEGKVCSPRVRSVSFVSPARADALPPAAAVKPITRSLQYWTPDGHNTWVGDVAPAVIDGRLHVFYLIDRRHHGSGGGIGRHQFAHLSSDDLVTWVEHPLAVPITESWQTVGTGTPFKKDGKLALAFGWHTDRIPGTKGKPIGGTYAVSDDGFRFRNSGEIITDAQNPSVYNRADGTYELVTSYGGPIGIFRSRDLRSWELFDAKLPFRGDCPSLFDWHGHRYLLQGFVNMAYSPDGTAGSFVDWSREPDKLYDGLGVPMVVPWKDDRRLYIGWLRSPFGWGGWLVFREVIAYPDGHLGLKWVPEIRPPAEPRTYHAKGGEVFRLCFDPEKGGAPLVLTVDPAHREATFLDDIPEVKVTEKTYEASNIGIGGVRGLDRDYDVRLIVHYDTKANVTVFDAEIAGQRTLIVKRRGRFKKEHELQGL